MQSVNQLIAQVKLLEIWKATNVENFPLKIEHREISEGHRITRSTNSDYILEQGKSNLTQMSFKSDAIKAWNKAPMAIKASKSLNIARKKIDW